MNVGEADKGERAKNAQNCQLVLVIYYTYIPIINYYCTICRRSLQIIYDGIMTLVGFSFVGNKLLLIT